MKTAFGKTVLGLSFFAFSAVAGADDVSDSLTKLAKSEVQQWLNSAVVLEQIKAQNSKNRGMSEADIVTLDKQWRAETSSSDRPLINKVLATELSSYLAELKKKSAGKYTEIFVMDAVGLNEARATSPLITGRATKPSGRKLTRQARTRSISERSKWMNPASNSRYNSACLWSKTVP